VNVEIREVNGDRVREQITLDGVGFLAERDVDTSFNPTRFQAAVVSPGGYQLAEIAPYLPPDTELKAGQRWDPIPGEFTIQPIGKRNLLSNAKVVGKEKVRVPAGNLKPGGSSRCPRRPTTTALQSGSSARFGTRQR
jgi:hypothetical protein